MNPSAPTGSSADHNSDFAKMFHIYIEAVKNRDGKKVAEFFRDDVEMTHVMPGPVIITDLKSYLDHQRHWHEGKTGHYNYRINALDSSTDLGFASVFAVYENFDLKTGQPFKLDLYISFVFRLVAGRWYMIRSQNSILKEVRGY